MKKGISVIVLSLLVMLFVFLACSKQSEGSGVSPTYKSEGTSTGNNPYNPPVSTT